MPAKKSSQLKKTPPKAVSKGDKSCPIGSKLVSTNYFAKVNLYANSRLPRDLPPVKL